MRWFISAYNIFNGVGLIVVLGLGLFALIRWRGWTRGLTVGAALLLISYFAVPLATDTDIARVSGTELLLLKKGRVWHIALHSIERMKFDPRTGEGCRDGIQIWMEGGRYLTFGEVCWGNSKTPPSPLASLLAQRAGLGNAEPGELKGELIWRRS